MASVCYRELFLLALIIIESEGFLSSNQCSSNEITTTCNGDDVNVLNLLTLLPCPTTNNGSTGLTTDWDRGEDMLPAACLAVERINDMPNILPGFRLKLVPSCTEVCRETVFPETLASFARYAVDVDCSIVGIVGLLCPSVTDVISRLAGRDEVRLVQASAGVSPHSFANSTEYPGLYRIVSSSAVYNKALVSIMKEFQWQKISIFFNNQQVYFSGTKDEFVDRIKDENLQLSLTEELSASSIPQIFEDLQIDGLRIAYGSMRIDEAALVLCEAYKRNLLWPNYVWIFHDHTVEDLIVNSNCGDENIKVALEGVFLFRLRLVADSDTQLVSGRTYVEEFSDNSELPANIYSRAVYDSIWTFALALNRTQGVLDRNALQMYSWGDKNVSMVIEREMRNVRFSGATGDISFSNTTREANTKVDIYQVRRGKAVHIGVYSPTIDSVVLMNITTADVPRDRFETTFVKVPLGLRCAALASAAVLFLLTTISLIMFIAFVDTPDIKAASPILSMVIFIGCYFLNVAAILTALRDFTLHESNTTPYAAICNCEVWFAALGLKLIFSTLFVRLLRVYRIFFNYNKMGKLWSNGSMMVMILLMVLPSVFFLLLWTTIDPLRTKTDDVVFMASSDPPFTEIRQSCSSEYLPAWLVPLLAYGSLILFLVGCLAIKTRKVTLDTFKDTKAVNSFIFMMAIILGVSIPFTILFTITDNNTTAASFVFQFLAILLTSALCQAFLFAPKYFMLLREKTHRAPTRKVSFAVDPGYSSRALSF